MTRKFATFLLIATASAGCLNFDENGRYACGRGQVCQSPTSESTGADPIEPVVESDGPRLLSSEPADGAMDVSIPRRLVLRFDRAMSASATRVTAEPTAGLGAASWSSDRKELSVAATDFHSAVHYRVLVSGADDAGKSLPASAGFSFSTAPLATSGAALLKAMPATNAIGVAPNTSITLLFAKPMDRASTERAFSVVPPRAGTITWNGQSTELTFQPAESLPRGETIEWQLEASAKNSAGAPMESGLKGAFRISRIASVDLESIAALDGWAGSSGESNLAETSMKIGDGANAVYRGLISFDLRALPSTATGIVDATLLVYQGGTFASPYTYLGKLMATSVFVGRTLPPPNLNLSILKTRQCSGSVCNLADETRLLSESAASAWLMVTATLKVQSDWAERTARQSLSQYMIWFSNDLGAKDAYWDLAYIVTAEAPAGRPTLRVTYEYP